MKFSIIISNRDVAGINIKNNLINLFSFERQKLDQIYSLMINEIFLFKDFLNIYNNLNNEKQKKSFLDNNEIYLIEINEETIFFDINKFDNMFNSDYYIFATRHQSKSGEKTFSLHYTGNFDKAEYGGFSGEFSKTEPLLMKIFFKKLNELGEKMRNYGFDITLEATHHGPFSKKPLLFIEIGSTLEEWKNEVAGQVIAHTIIESIKEFCYYHQNISSKSMKESNFFDDLFFNPNKIALCFGGLHYCHNFNKILLYSDYSFSHICPKYNISFLSEEKIDKMINSSSKKAETAILDWKGINSKDKDFLISLLEKANLKWLKIKDIKI